MDTLIYKKITSKKELSQLPKKDVGIAYNKFKKRRFSEEEKIRLTRKLLHEVYGAFASSKLLGLKKSKSFEWVLRKHLSTRERLAYYLKIYKRIFKNINQKVSVIDLGCGVNGFSYNFMKNYIKEYLGIEGVGQLVDLQNKYFKRHNLNGRVFHLSLFELEKIKSIIKNVRKPRVVFLFKVVDNLEMLERDYSKKSLLSLKEDVDFFVISFATRSMISRRKFKINRKWILEFIKRKFIILDDFELGGERYLVLKTEQQTL